MSNQTKLKNKILSTYLKLHKKLKYVSLLDLKASNITRAMIRYNFGSIAKLDEEARLKYPDKFKDIHIDQLITPKYKKRLDATLASYKKFVITTAVTGCEVDKKALETVKFFCKKTKSKLLVLVCSDPAQKTNQKKGYGTIDAILSDELIITEDTELNSNFFISTLKTTAKQIDPTTGLVRIGQGEGSFVYASPKQRMLPAATSNNKMPRAIMTTGAITKSNYNTEKYMSERTAYLAEYDHKMGAIIVEIEDDQIFHFRQIQFDKKGRFADFGIMYDKNNCYIYPPDSFLFGDLHSGDTDPVVRKILMQLVNELNPKRIIINDGFNGSSINPHEKHNSILRAIRSENYQLSLEEELKLFAKDLNEFSKKVKEVVVVKSNHDVFLERYLTECDFRKDPQNLRICLELALSMLNKLDPLKIGIEKMGLKYPEKIRWLKRDEDFKVAGIQLGCHGDQGPNGSRGTLANMEKAYGKCFSGHSHTPQILRDAWSVGTSTYLKLGYNEGPSSWVQSHGLVYPNGMRQLINTINGKYRL